MNSRRFTLLIAVLGILLIPRVTHSYWYDHSFSFVNVAPGEVDPGRVKNFTAKIATLSESGAPYAGVYIRVFDSSGVKLFSEMCEKPLLFMKLQAGDYNVIAIDRKQVQRIKPFSIKKNQSTPTLVKLKWPKDDVGY